MPRHALPRPAAKPTSLRQQERHRNIIRAARRLTIKHGEDAVQMTEVASEAGVALNTLYRYFPSKAQLYTAVLAEEIERLGKQFPLQRVTTDAQAAGNVMRVIDTASEALFGRPLLAKAVMNASLSSSGESVARSEEALESAILAALGIEEPTETDRRMCYMINVCWSGVLTSVLNGRMQRDEYATLVHLSVKQLVLVRSTR